jgi:hypothetical protein
MPRPAETSDTSENVSSHNLSKNRALDAKLALLFNSRSKTFAGNGCRPASIPLGEDFLYPREFALCLLEPLKEHVRSLCAVILRKVPDDFHGVRVQYFADLNQCWHGDPVRPTLIFLYLLKRDAKSCRDLLL